MNKTTVRVDFSVHGAWKIDLPDAPEPIAFNTLDEASRAARRYAAERSPSELVVCDAYHRVLHSELIVASE